MLKKRSVASIALAGLILGSGSTLMAPLAGAQEVSDTTNVAEVLVDNGVSGEGWSVKNITSNGSIFSYQSLGESDLLAEHGYKNTDGSIITDDYSYSADVEVEKGSTFSVKDIAFQQEDGPAKANGSAWVININDYQPNGITSEIGTYSSADLEEGETIVPGTENNTFNFTIPENYDGPSTFDIVLTGQNPELLQDFIDEGVEFVENPAFGDEITFTVTVTDPEETPVDEDETETPVTTEASYNNGVISDTETVVLELSNVDLNDVAALSIDGDYVIPEGWSVQLDVNTGALTVSADKDIVDDNTSITVPVNIVNTNGETTVVNATITTDYEGTNDDDTDETDVDDINIASTYNHSTIKEGESISITPFLENIPEGSVFNIPEDFVAPEGWVITIDADTGVITVTAPEEAEVGTLVQIPVTVSSPEGELVTESEAGVTIVDDTTALADLYELSYPESEVTPGEQLTVDYVSETTIPTGTVFSLDEESVPEGWAIEINDITGQLTVVVPEDAEIGDIAEIDITVTYPDESVDEVSTVFTVTEEDEGGLGTTPAPNYPKFPQIDSDVLFNGNNNIKNTSSQQDLANTGVSSDVIAGGLLASLLSGLLGFAGLRKFKK